MHIWSKHKVYYATLGTEGVRVGLKMGNGYRYSYWRSAIPEYVEDAAAATTGASGSVDAADE